MFLNPLSGYLTLGSRLHVGKIPNGHSFNFGPSSAESHSVLELVQMMSKSWNKVIWEDCSSNKEEFHEARFIEIKLRQSIRHA